MISFCLICICFACQDIFLLQKFYLHCKILREATIETWFPLENSKISQMQSIIRQIFVIKCRIFETKFRIFVMLCQIFVLFTFICTELWSSFESSRFWGGSGMLKREGVINNRMCGNSGEIIKNRRNCHERLHVSYE